MLLILVSVILACFSGYPPISKSVGPRVEKVTVAGLRELIAQQRGNVVLVNAWATWCIPCRKEMPALLRLRQEFKGKGLKVILLSADEPDLLHSTVRPTLHKLGVDFTSYLIDDVSDDAFIKSMSPSWNGALPTTFVYDRSGTLIETVIGARDYKQFKELATRTLAKR